MEVRERKMGIKDRGWWGQQQKNRTNDFKVSELIWKDLIRERKKSERKKGKFKIENEMKQSQFYQHESIPRLVLIVCICESAVCVGVRRKHQPVGLKKTRFWIHFEGTKWPWGPHSQEDTAVQQPDSIFLFISTAERDGERERRCNKEMEWACLSSSL